ncbi:hypothetical protein BO85DRAFT_473678 [Aspergillus piperis CBS 112811]|uniref:Protein kinase domain-containing protein n=1 Tax=Aspergillus piperis CBS 112811 TaxID=1448313 RepID=A0A8G1VRL8_9EURO|nr:hypothetical protein BO85DRAFT_473678 [Aspergillus piperis CBS 112811]RAH63051.1 hypothetical protein BO85DRAFT_473678 [Aspergillus piperis CBS 112811]
MDCEGSLDYKALYFEAKAELDRERERTRKAEERADMCLKMAKNVKKHKQENLMHGGEVKKHETELMQGKIVNEQQLKEDGGHQESDESQKQEVEEQWPKLCLPNLSASFDQGNLLGIQTSGRLSHSRLIEQKLLFLICGFCQAESFMTLPSIMNSSKDRYMPDAEDGMHGRSLDKQCPNVALHRLGANDDHHQILPETLVRKIEKQLNKEFDHGCTPIGGCASTGSLFKITSSTLGYTVVGKGASSELWKEKVSHEADIYRILHQAQGSAVPVVLGTVDLRMAHFSNGTEINHMLLMAWAGEQIDNCEDKSFKREVKRSEKEIRSLGVIHHNIQPQNALWNPELRRALIIDFDCSQLDSLPIEKRQLLMGKKIRDPYGRKRPSSVPLE